jgi:hypothetical protein
LNLRCCFSESTKVSTSIIIARNHYYFVVAMPRLNDSGAQAQFSGLLSCRSC